MLKKEALIFQELLPSVYLAKSGHPWGRSDTVTPSTEICKAEEGAPECSGEGTTTRFGHCKRRQGLQMAQCVLRLGKQGSENPRLSRRRLAGATAEPLWGPGGAPSTDNLVNMTQNEIGRAHV